MNQRIGVLIVDASEDDAEAIVRALRRSGFDPAAHRVDTDEAVAAALARQPWELIVVDEGTSDVNVERALRRVHEAALDAPVIVVSATADEEAAVALMMAGAHDVVLEHELGRLGAVATRELHAAEVRRQRRQDEAALQIFAAAGRLTVEAPDFDTIVRRAARIPVPLLADWSIVFARDRDAISDAVATACRPEVDRAALDELARRYPPMVDGADPIFGSAVRTRTASVISIASDDALAALARDDRHLALLRRLGPRSLIVTPQIVRDHLVGMLVLASLRPGRYGDAELEIARELGGRIALLAENARLTHAREEFISTAIHEIKTPIAVIKTGVQLMQRLPPERRNERLPELLARLDRQCNRLNRLVTEVLEVSRLDLKRTTIVRHPTDLAALVQRVVGEMREASARHEIVIRRNDAVTVDVDPDRIEQVLTNLVSNAVKYSPSGGEIEIEARREPGEVVVSVRDHGIGIPRDKQARIFERFYSAHAGTRYAPTSSLGVGLYLSHEFVTLHGGRMWFESQEGGGSIFAFSLPVAGEGGP